MEFKVIRSEAALADLRDLCAFIAHDNPDAALRMGRGIVAHVRILASFSLIGPVYPRGARGPLREIVYRSYRIFYDVSESARTVEILHVWHGARDEPTFQFIASQRLASSSSFVGSMTVPAGQETSGSRLSDDSPSVVRPVRVIPEKRPNADVPHAARQQLLAEDRRGS